MLSVHIALNDNDNLAFAREKQQFWCQIRHKPACTSTEDGWKLDILDLRIRGFVVPCSDNKGADK